MKPKRKSGLLLPILLVFVASIFAFKSSARVITSQEIPRESSFQTQTSDDEVNTTLMVEVGSSDVTTWINQVLNMSETVIKKRFRVDKNPAIFFETTFKNQRQRGIAYNLESDQGIVYLTTNLGSSKARIVEGAKTFLRMQNQEQDIRLHLTPDQCASQNLCNCVLYARCFVSTLPTGLWTITDKRATMNHYFPRVPSVAVHPLSLPDGHVSVVTSVGIRPDGNLQVSIREGNYASCQQTFRSGTPEALQIDGYYDPVYTAGQKSNAAYVSGATNTTGTSGIPFTVRLNGSGFDPSTCKAIILGGWCDSFGKCSVPNSNFQYKSSSYLEVPLVLNSPGTYYLYIFNEAAGKTSNGVRLTVQ